MILSSTLFVLAALIAAQPTALAQDNPSALDPKGCAPGERPQPGPRGPKPPATTGQGESTADKLARTDGVICPPDVDREMKAPTPDAGRTPVIPPPGSPGGQKDIEPK
jgi:hypothetical protein